MIGKFFYLEGAYLILAGIILLITLFVTTIPFMSKDAPKKGLMWVSIVLVIFIGGHFYVTTSRIAEVKKAFNDGETVVCESRMIRKVAQSIRIQKGKSGWHMDGDNFVSPYYTRPFHMARCIVEWR